MSDWKKAMAEMHESKRVGDLMKVRITPAYDWAGYEHRVKELVDSGLTNGDAQAVVDAEDLKKSRKGKDNVEL
jgi:hypothetical protein